MEISGWALMDLLCLTLSEAAGCAWVSPGRTGLGTPGTGSSLRSFPPTSQGHLDLQERVGISTLCHEQGLERAAGK